MPDSEKNTTELRLSRVEGIKMHADNNKPDLAYRLVDRYYLGMIDDDGQPLFYVWFGSCWAFINPNPETWNGHIYTFCSMTEQTALETIGEVHGYISPYKKSSALYRDYSKFRIFLIPAIDAPLWGLPAGVKE